MKRLSAKELDAAREAFYQESEAQVNALGQSLQEFLLLECKGRRIPPDVALIALIELCATSAAFYSHGNERKMLGCLSHFFQVFGLVSNRPDLMELGAKILTAIKEED